MDGGVGPWGNDFLLGTAPLLASLSLVIFHDVLPWSYLSVLQSCAAQRVTLSKSHVLLMPLSLGKARKEKAAVAFSSFTLR